MKLLFLPEYQTRTSNFSIWVFRKIKAKIVEKAAHRKYKENSKYQSYSELRLRCTELADICYYRYIFNIANQIISTLFLPFLFLLFFLPFFPQSIFLGEPKVRGGEQIVNLIDHFRSTFQKFRPTWCHQNEQCRCEPLLLSLFVLRVKINMKLATTDLFVFSRQFLRCLKRGLCQF